jgi:hypothetical protein
VYTATLYVIVNIVEGGGRAFPTLTGRANFFIMMECNVRKEAAVATLCVLCGVESPQILKYLVSGFSGMDR